jgi:hypothetical protein
VYPVVQEFILEAAKKASPAAQKTSKIKPNRPLALKKSAPSATKKIAVKKSRRI